jgi:hypothetical protein
MAKRAHGHQRTVVIATRWSPQEIKRLVPRRIKSGAKSNPAYIRAAALTGVEFEMPAYEMQREQWSAVIRLAAVLETYPPTKLVTETLAEAKATLGRMCRA